MTQVIDQSSFESFQESKESLTLDFGASGGVPIKEVPGPSVLLLKDVSIGYDGTETSIRKVSKYFEERNNFSVGKQIPAGGTGDWKKDTMGEPMPIKFSFVSLCNHPVFKHKTAD